MDRLRYDGASVADHARFISGDIGTCCVFDGLYFEAMAEFMQCLKNQGCWDLAAHTDLVLLAG